MGKRYKYIGSGDSWGTELFLVFLLGFVLATGLWLGVWYVHAKPTHADSLQSCLAEKQGLAQLRARIEIQKQDSEQKLKEVNAKLEDALAGWGRCIRSQTPADTREKPVESTSSPSSVDSKPIAKRQ